jgi:IclR family transcriptional regulator, acetate operon repressor
VDPVPVTGTQAIDRAAQLLVLVIEGEAMTVGELAAATGLPKSTASRLIGSLERHGLVQRDSIRGVLRPGAVLMRFVHRGLAGRDLVELADPYLRHVAEVSGETVNLAVPTPAGVEHLAQIDSRHFLGAGNWLGRRVPHHASAVGKVFLAYDVARLPRGPLLRLAEHTITDRRQLLQDVERVQTRGWAAAVDELENGLTAVAAPVRGPGGDVIAALAITGPTLRIPPDRLETLGRLCAEQAALLSKRLGLSTTSEGAA